MRVIFLDIDGVLNHADFLYAREESRQDGERLKPDDAIDRACIAHLNTIIERTGAVVVISSSWRILRTADQMQTILDRHGFSGEVICCTTTEAMETRGCQIAEWLDGRDVDSFVILDDDLDVYPLAHKHVRTKMMDGGLTEEHARKAVRMLTDEGGL